MLACDCTITSILLDDKEVPLQLGRTQRLVRRACAAPSSPAMSGVCAAAPPPPGPRPTTWSIGARAAQPTWTTSPCCVVAAIANCTAAIGNSSWARTGTRGSCHRNGSTNTENPCRDTSGAPTRRRHDECIRDAAASIQRHRLHRQQFHVGDACPGRRESVLVRRPSWAGGVRRLRQSRMLAFVVPAPSAPVGGFDPDGAAVARDHPFTARQCLAQHSRQRDTSTLPGGHP